MKRLVVVLVLALGAGLWWWSSSASDDPAARRAALEGDAQAAYDAGDHEASAAAWLRIEELAREAGDEAGVVAARAQRGVCLKMLDRIDEARALMEPALARARALGLARVEGLALGNMARIESMSDDLEAALGYLDELVAFSVEHADERTEILTREQAAVLVDRLGRPEEAVRRFDEALARQAVLDLGDDDRTAALHRQKGAALLRLGDDLGALAAWDAGGDAATTLANRAQQLALLGLHAEAAETALAAARAFEGEADRRDGARDQALALSFGELLLSGQLEACRRELDAVLAGADDPVSRAPFELVAARLELTEGDAPAAAELARSARTAAADELLAQQAGWIEAVALVKSARPDEALDVLAALPDSLARTVLHGWLLDVVPDTSATAAELLPRLDPATDDADDASLSVLRRTCPEPLPGPAWLALHLALSDADRLRAIGQDAAADARLDDGIVAALRWQASETLEAVLGRRPDAALVDSEERVRGWLAGGLPPEEAVVAVLPGVRHSYLVIFTSDLGGTTFGLPPGASLLGATEAVVDAMRGGRLDAVAHASHDLYTKLLDERALADLEGRTLWTLLLPDELTGVPPGMWVTRRWSGGPVAWLLRDHDVRLMPYVAPEGLGERGLAPAAPAGDGRWARFGEPALDVDELSLAAAAARGAFGSGALATGTLRSGEPEPVRGDACTTAAVLDALRDAAVVELSVPGVGGDRLGGLLLAPDASAPRGDAAAGLLPWRRLAGSPIGADVVLDRTRFDPSDVRHGAAHAAAALVAGGARQVLLTRWPLPDTLRDGMLERLQAGADGSRPLWSLIGHAQRLFVAGAEGEGLVDRTHPLFWAGWLPFDVGP